MLNLFRGHHFHPTNPCLAARCSGQAQMKIIGLLLLVTVVGVLAVVFRPQQEVEVGPLVAAPDTGSTNQPPLGAPAALPMKSAESTSPTEAPKTPDGATVVAEDENRSVGMPDLSEEMRAAQVETYKKAHATFEDEAVDYAWAMDYEQLLTTVFSKVDDLESVSVSAIECRSTMCRVTAYTANQKDADAFTSAFYRAFERYEGGRYKPSNSSSLQNLEAGETTIFITREGNTPTYF